MSAQASFNGQPPGTVNVQQPRMGAGGATRRPQVASATAPRASPTNADSASVISDITTLRWDMNGNPIN